MEPVLELKIEMLKSIIGIVHTIAVMGFVVPLIVFGIAVLIKYWARRP